MSKSYITFDSYYSVDKYNQFLSAAKNNSINYLEYICVRTPYEWYIAIDNKDLPNFLNYDEISATNEKYLVSVLKPRDSSGRVSLLRRETDSPLKIEKFVSPNALKLARTKESVTVFRGFSKTRIIELSRVLGKDKNSIIYSLGDSKKGEIFFTFNPYIRSIISQNNIILEVNSKSDYNKVGEIESFINYNYLRVEKLTYKSHLLDMWVGGKVIKQKPLMI